MKWSGIGFGGIFLLAGLAAFAFFVAKPVYDAVQMLGWQSHPATLQHAQVNQTQSRNDDGTYTTLYSVEVAYQYQIDGRTYYGSRANVSGINTSDSDVHYRLLSKIKTAASRDQLRVWVDPNDAMQSVVDRSLDARYLLMMTLFTGVFVVVGGGIVAVSRKGTQPLPAGVVADPSKPWTTRAQWASATIYSNVASKLGVIKFAVILASMFFGMFTVGLIGKSTVATGFAIVLMVPPVLLLRWYQKKYQDYKQYQAVPVQLTPYPGVVGGMVGGSILIPKPYASGDTYNIELRCTNHRRTRSGNETRHESSVIWFEKATPKLLSKLGKTQLEFAFNVPADKPPSSDPDNNNYDTYTLLITSELDGVNFNREYELPVFVTEDSNTVADELQANPLSAQEKAAIDTRLNISLDDEMTLHTPGSKTGWLIAGMGSLFFMIGLGIALIAESFFGFVFSAMALLFIVFGMLVVGRNCKIRVTPNRLEIDVYLFSKLVNQHQFTHQQVKEIKAFKSSSSSTNGQQTDEKYCLKVFTKAGKMVDMQGEFKTMKNATHVKQQIEAILSEPA